MRYRALGRTGVEVSEVGLGTHVHWGEAVGPDEAGALVRAALDLGVNLFDTADTYGGGRAEALLGGALAGLDHASFAVVTKCCLPRTTARTDRGLSRKHLLDSVARSLAALRLDYVDVLLCHRFDDSTPLEETVSALGDLVGQGRVAYWGVSGWSAAQWVEAEGLSRALGAQRPAVHQLGYSVLYRGAEDELLPRMREAGAGVMAYGALAQGVLTGKYDREPWAEDSRARRVGTVGMHHLGAAELDRARAFNGAAREAGLTPAGAALSWCLRRPEVSSVLVGARTPAQLRELAGSVVDPGDGRVAAVAAAVARVAT